MNRLNGNLCLKVELDRIIGGPNGRILGSIRHHCKYLDVSEIFSLVSVEKDIGKILTAAQSAKKKKKKSLVIKH